MCTHKYILNVSLVGLSLVECEVVLGTFFIHSELRFAQLIIFSDGDSRKKRTENTYHLTYELQGDGDAHSSHRTHR